MPKYYYMPARIEIDTSTYSGRFAVRLRELREKAGLSVQEVSMTIGVPERTLYGWEAAYSEPRYDILPVLAALYGVKSPRTLLPER